MFQSNKTDKRLKRGFSFSIDVIREKKACVQLLDRRLFLFPSLCR